MSSPRFPKESRLRDWRWVHELLSPSHNFLSRSHLGLQLRPSASRRRFDSGARSPFVLECGPDGDCLNFPNRGNRSRRCTRVTIDAVEPALCCCLHRLRSSPSPQRLHCFPWQQQQGCNYSLTWGLLLSPSTVSYLSPSALPLY
jgi:hypothetical protein